MDPVVASQVAPTDHDIRRRGALVAAAIAAAWLIGGLLFSLFNPNSWPIFLTLLLPPVLIVSLAGRKLAIKAVRAESAVPAAIELSVLTVVLNSFAVAFIWMSSSIWAPPDWAAPSSPLETVLGLLPAAFAMGLLGLIFFGIPAFIPAIFSAAVWATVLRRMFRKPAH